MKLTQEQIDRVKSLADVDGRLTPDAVVDDARLKTSPLHGLFDWDVKKAAFEHWRDVAREVIGAVRIMVVNQTVTCPSPMYVRDPDAAGKQGYRSVVALKSEPDRAREALLAALAVAAGHLQRAYEIAAVLGLQADVDALLEQVAGVRRALEEAA